MYSFLLLCVGVTEKNSFFFTHKNKNTQGKEGRREGGKEELNTICVMEEKCQQGKVKTSKQKMNTQTYAQV